MMKMGKASLIGRMVMTIIEMGTQWMSRDRLTDVRLLGTQVCFLYSLKKFTEASLCLVYLIKTDYASQTTVIFSVAIIAANTTITL